MARTRVDASPSSAASRSRTRWRPTRTSPTRGEAEGVQGVGDRLALRIEDPLAGHDVNGNAIAGHPRGSSGGLVGGGGVLGDGCGRSPRGRRRRRRRRVEPGAPPSPAPSSGAGATVAVVERVTGKRAGELLAADVSVRSVVVLPVAGETVEQADEDRGDQSVEDVGHGRREEELLGEEDHADDGRRRRAASRGSVARCDSRSSASPHTARC